MDESIVAVKNFTKVYGEFVAVDDISFEVQPGEIFGLLGPNGAGKTTTLECLEGLRKPDRGEMQIKGVDPQKEPGKLRNVIGVQLQTSGLPASMTVEESLNIFSAYHGVLPSNDLFTRLGLDEKRKTRHFRPHQKILSV